MFALLLSVLLWLFFARYHTLTPTVTYVNLFVVSQHRSVVQDK
jgi:hypothetical protein